MIKFLLFYFLLFSSLLYADPLAQKLSLNGHYIQGGLLYGKTLPGSKIAFQDKPIRISEKGLFIIAFHRDEKLQSHLKITFTDGQRIDKLISIRSRKYKTQRIDGLPSAKVSPRKAATIERINKEIALIKKARNRDDNRLDFMEKFIWPVIGPISGVYGSQRILNGHPRRPHYGVDIARPTGTPVVAPASGIITLAQKDMFFSGGTVMLDHGFGLSSSFLHLSKLYVKVGDRIKQGQLIAAVGATGRVTGAHLDWRMNWFNKRIDPELLVAPMLTKKNGIKEK